jgi:16S rRNA (adenine1518-N6/adenine1519-N6)-dimethyltransferase
METTSDLKAKKSLGQNFLKSERALNSIIKASDLKQEDFVVEIGPGKGALTIKLLESEAGVLAIEKDNRMCEFLKDNFKNSLNKNFSLLCGDILEMDLEKLKSIATKYKLIANIPYYITGAIIRKFLSGVHQPERMVLLMQKEVAERIIAKNQKESLLSISVKAYCEPVFIEVVKAGSFVPAPSVDSAIVLFQNISKKNFTENNIGEDLFFEVLNAGFAHKRKILLSNLKDWQKRKSKNQGVDNKNLAKINFSEIFKKLKLDSKIRAENLKTGQWFEITQEIN